MSEQPGGTAPPRRGRPAVVWAVAAGIVIIIVLWLLLALASDGPRSEFVQLERSHVEAVPLRPVVSIGGVLGLGAMALFLAVTLAPIALAVYVVVLLHRLLHVAERIEQRLNRSPPGPPGPDR